MGFLARAGHQGFGSNAVDFGLGPEPRLVVQPAVGGDSAAATKRRQRPRVLVEYVHPCPSDAAMASAATWTWEDERGRRLLEVAGAEGVRVTKGDLLLAAAAAGAAAALVVVLVSKSRTSRPRKR